MVETEGQIIYATNRKDCQSSVLVTLLTKFGQSQGFEKIIQLCNNKDSSMEHIADLIVCISGCTNMYHKSFIDSYFVRLSKAVETKILTSSEAILRTLDKPSMDSIEKLLWGALMKRIWDTATHQRETTLINTNVAVCFVKQNLMAQRINGAGTLNKILKDVCPKSAAIDNESKQTLKASVLKLVHEQ